ncbi:coiled-coil domain-containing protein 115-like [Trichosurus vulpecula]|uniref:coiled-coil domain-containing protein 115-like n=1 Tax=Trichosurus vulpecula TaxID=9337 RepID=UPI00186B314C|nr:coiled-coil domain-containing protein 115-like [Trichosurus vulpecula]
MAAAGGGESAVASEAGALRALSTQLDATLVQLLVELEQLEGKRVALNARVEEGWFSLSKTRYAMGAKAVSPLQYSSSMTPFFRVCTSEPEPGRPEFEVIFTGTGSPKDGRPQESQGVSDYGEPESESQSPVLRRRPQPQGSPLQPTPPTPAAATSPERDPLTWFGILVPQSLRQAQGSFRAALLVAGEIAALQSRIEWGRAQIQALLQEKQKLLDQLKVA